MISVEVDHAMTDDESVHVPRTDPSGITVTIVGTSGGSGDVNDPPMFTTARLSVAGPDAAVERWLVERGHRMADAEVLHRWDDGPAPVTVPPDHPLAGPVVEPDEPPAIGGPGAPFHFAATGEEPEE